MADRCVGGVLRPEMHTYHFAIRAWTLAALLAMGALLTALAAIV